MSNQPQNRTLFTGDNLEVMRAMNSETVDLIYLDPPFNKKYVFVIGKSGKEKEFGFKDIWGWDSPADETNPFLPYAELYAFDELNNAATYVNPLIDSALAKKIIKFLEVMSEIAGHPEMAYLSFMAARLIEMKRLLKPTGSIYLHCDPTMSHSLKLLMDMVFGGNQFLNDTIWTYDGPQSPSKKKFATKHDNILRYAKNIKKVFVSYEDIFKMILIEEPELTKDYKKDEGGYFYDLPPGEYTESSICKLAEEGRVRKTKNGKVRIKYYLIEQNGNHYRRKKIPSVWADIPSLGQSGGKQKTGFQTQKPVLLLERIIKASSNEGDLVLDPFCGCATTCIAAERLGRQWIGIDVGEKAAGLVRARLLSETEQGKLGDKIPKINHREFYKGDCPMRTDMGETRHPQIKKILYGDQTGNCNLCKKHFDIQYFHVDHIIARAKGGPDVDRNLQLLCGSCNTVKGTRTMEGAKKRLKELGYIV